MKTPKEGEGGSGAKSGSDSETWRVNADEKKQPHYALFPFAIVSSTYILFTITDGAVRMIVLLHAHGKSFTAMEIAIMFSLYELMGVLTNLIAGIQIILLDEISGDFKCRDSSSFAHPTL